MKKRDGREDRQNAEWLCMKWPSSSNGTSSGCKLEVPWVFKSLKNVGILAVEQFEQIKQQRPNAAPRAPIQGLQKVVRAPFYVADAPNSGSTASISKSDRRNDFPLVQQFLPQVQGVLLNLGQWGKKKEAAGVSLSQDELGELEERALAQALARRKPATVIEFYSPRCKLCRSLVPVVAEVESKYEEWLHVVMADVENQRWLPEAGGLGPFIEHKFSIYCSYHSTGNDQVLQYDIKYVPCFLLLDSYGNALAKTAVPYSRKHVLQGLSYLLESMKPIRNNVKFLQPR